MESRRFACAVALAHSPRLSRSGLDALLWASGFATGVLLPERGASAFCRALLALAALALGLRARCVSGPPRSSPRAVALDLATVVVLPLVLGAATGHVHHLLDPVPALLSEWEAHGFLPGVTPVGIRGRLLDAQELPDRRVALLLRIDRYRLPGRVAIQGAPRRSVLVRLTAPLPPAAGGTPWRPGDRLDLTARLGPPRNFRNPGAFDYAAYLEARDIGLVGTIKSPQLVTVVAAERQAWLDLLPGLRRSIVESIARAAGPEHGATAAFLSALLVGEREELPQEIEETLRRAGIYHIIALSGLNVAVIAILTSLVLKLLPMRQRIRRAGAACGVLLYWLVARDSGSISRAALMALLYLSGAMLERRMSGLASLSIAAVLILLRQPGWTGDAGFQLTFGATLSLLVLGSGGAERAPGRRTRLRVMASVVRASVRVSAAALAGTALVTACHFQSMAPIALAANLYAVPIANVLMLMALGVALFDPPFPCLARGLAALADRLIGVLVTASRWVAAPAWVSFHVVPPPPFLVLCGSAAMILCGVLGSRTGRRTAGGMLVAALLWAAAGGRAGGGGHNLEVTVLDVGQGDSILVRLPNDTTLLVDAGGYARSGFDVGDRVVAPALRALGRLRIDILAITHAHRDHIGGAPAILKQFSPGALWLGRMPPEDPAVLDLERLAASRHIPVVRPRRGARLAIGGAVLEVLNPGFGVPAEGGATNSDSLVLRIIAGGHAVLLTGDLEAPLESILVSEDRNLRADLLKVGHHGSRTSSSAPFLARVHADLAAVSVGAGNPWGHPDEEVLRRLHGAGILVFRTDRVGAIRFRTDGSASWAGEALITPEEPDSIGLSEPGRPPG